MKNACECVFFRVQYYCRPSSI